MTASSDLRQTPGSTDLPPQPLQRRLYRSRTNRVFAGVCGGVAEYFGAEPTAVRLLAVVIALFTALVPMILLYLVAAIIVPEQGAGEVSPGDPTARIAASRGQGRLVLGVVFVGLGVLALANELFRIDWQLLWPVGLILVGGGLVLAAQRR
jgi:phage shock protein C